MNEWKLPIGENTIRSRYVEFRTLLSLNNDCLEILASIQEDLHFIAAGREVPGERASGIFDKLGDLVGTLERVTGNRYRQLTAAVSLQRRELDAWVAVQSRQAPAPFVMRLDAVDRRSELLVGGKAAVLGEIRNRLLLPVPDGWVVTAEAYRRLFGTFLWKEVRDLTRRIDLDDLMRLEETSARLVQAVQQCPIPRVIAEAIDERVLHLVSPGGKLAVRSSAVGEGGRRTFAGQFRTVLQVDPEHAVDAWREVVASRFSATALSYRLSAGMPDVESPMAALFMPMLRTRAFGIVYTRDPGDRKSDVLWVTATGGVPGDSSSSTAELRVVSRSEPYREIESHIVPSGEPIAVHRDDGNSCCRADGPRTLNGEHLRQLAAWGCRIEQYLGCPQDIEWVLDEDDKLWIVQARQLVLTRQDNRHIPPQVRTQPILSGGVGVYPGRVSGVAYLAHDLASLGSTPPGAILFLRKASPDIAEVLPRISGLVAEWGNLTGHAAALLREFRIPSAFQMAGAFETVRPGTPVSLDAVKPRVYTGTFWPASRSETPALQAEDARQETPIESCLLRLHLLDSSAIGFRPGACRSAHDVLRYCHQTAIHAMFTLNDGRLSREGETASRLVTSAPIDLRVLDLGGGLAASARGSRDVRPEQIVSRPFRFLWQGMTGPAAECRCDQPIGLADLASVMTTSLSHCPESGRALGESGYLIVAAEYMNLNARLAYHFALMDACITDTPRNNSISFRFAGGGASRNRRDLRARFLERCLAHYGFQVRCRGDLVDAWYRKAPATEMEHRLEMLGSLIAWSSRLDMYMSSYQVMDWYRKRFLERNAMIPPGGLVCETCGSVAETPDRHEVSA